MGNLSQLQQMPTTQVEQQLPVQQLLKTILLRQQLQKSLAISCGAVDADSGKFVVKASAAGEAAGNKIQVAVTGGAKELLGNINGTIDTRVTDEKAIAERNKYIEQFNSVLGQIGLFWQKMPVIKALTCCKKMI